MKIKKTVGALCALAMAVTAFAGLAVTANAAGKELDVLTFDTVSADGKKFEKNQVIGETIVYEFDVYVPNRTKTSFAYYNNGNLGPTFIFDAQQESGKVWVKYQTGSEGPHEINSNDPYSWYLADSSAHVAISNPIGSDGSIGDAKIQLSSVGGNDSPFVQYKDGSPVIRYPYNNRPISHRNIRNSRLLNNIRVTIDNAETDGVKITNQKLYTVASNLTINAPNATISGLPADKKSYNPQTGLIADNTYNLTITPNANYTIDAVKVNDTKVEAVNGVYTVTINADTKIDVETTEIAPPVPEQVTAEQVTVEGYGDVKAFAVKDVTLNGNAPTWTVTAVKDTETKTETITANIPTVHSESVNLGLIVNNVPDDVTVSATLGYTK